MNLIALDQMKCTVRAWARLKVREIEDELRKPRDASAMEHFLGEWLAESLLKFNEAQQNYIRQMERLLTEQIRHELPTFVIAEAQTSAGAAPQEQSRILGEQATQAGLTK